MLNNQKLFAPTISDPEVLIWLFVFTFLDDVPSCISLLNCQFLPSVNMILLAVIHSI